MDRQQPAECISTGKEGYSRESKRNRRVPAPPLPVTKNCLEKFESGQPRRSKGIEGIKIKLRVIIMMKKKVTVKKRVKK